MVDFKSACFLLCAYAADTNFNAYFTLHDSCAAAGEGPVRHTFQSEPAKRRRQLAGIYVRYTVCV